MLTQIQQVLRKADDDGGDDDEQVIDRLPLFSPAQLQQFKLEKKARNKRLRKRKRTLEQLDEEKDDQIKVALAPVLNAEKRLKEEYESKLQTLEAKKEKLKKPIHEEWQNKRARLDTQEFEQDVVERQFSKQWNTCIRLMQWLQSPSNKNKWVAVWASDLIDKEDDCMLWSEKLPEQVERSFGDMKVHMSSDELPSGVTDNYDLRQHQYQINWTVNFDDCKMTAFGAVFSIKETSKLQQNIDWSWIEEIKDHLEDELKSENVRIRDAVIECGDWDDPRYATFDYVKKDAICFLKLKI